MTVVDGHVHVGLTKYVAVEVLVAQMEAAGIDKALLVQYGGCYDNAYLSACMRRYPGRFASLGAVDYAAPDAPKQIRDQVTTHGLAGLRISAAVDNAAIWETIGELGIMASLTGGMPRITDPRVEGYIRAYPQAAFRIEHMGWFPDVDGSPDDPAFARLMEYAAYPNVVFMLSGFYAFGRGYPYPEAIPFVRRALQCFGPQRLIWGSDFPPVTAKETCEMALAMPRGWDFLTEEDLAWILGKAALRVLDF
jgi:predicted TIM-barrel fold metal-dependent hydrolase